MGSPVEVNALWYNALCYMLENAKREKNQALQNEWAEIVSTCEKSFINAFWDSDKGYLADCVDGDSKDWTLRPNQVIAAAMPYTPLPEEMRKSLLSRVKRELLTPSDFARYRPLTPIITGVITGIRWPEIRLIIRGRLSPGCWDSLPKGISAFMVKVACRSSKTFFTDLNRK